MTLRPAPSGRGLRLAIVGAGLLGRMLARHEQRRGNQVTLFEASPFGVPVSAAHTAAAMISPYSEVVVSERPIFEMGLASLALWPQLLDELGPAAETPVQYAAPGSLVVAHPQDRAELDQFKRDLAFKLGAADESRWWQRPQLAENEAALEHFGEALYLPGEAFLDNRRLLSVLLESARRLGAECRDRSSVEISPEGPVCNGEVLSGFDLVIDCRGIGSKPQEADLRGVRGEVMWVETTEIALRHAVRLMHPRYKLYVVPKPENRFIIGATEIESEDRSPITLQSTLELASALYTVHPALAEARVIETDSNLRPAFRDNLPRITVRGQTISVNGLYRHGYLLAPVVVEHLSNHINGQEPGAFRTLLFREAETKAGEQTQWHE